MSPNRPESRQPAPGGKVMTHRWIRPAATCISFSVRDGRPHISSSIALYSSRLAGSRVRVRSTEFHQKPITYWHIAAGRSFAALKKTPSNEHHQWKPSISLSTWRRSGPMSAQSSTCIAIGRVRTCSDLAICTTPSTKNRLNVPGMPAVPKSQQTFTSRYSGPRCSSQNRERKKGHSSGAIGK